MDIIHEFITNQDIVKLVLSDPDPTEDIVDQLVGYTDKNGGRHDGVILPFLYVPNRIDNASTFICMDTTIRDSTATVQNLYVYINIFTEKSLMKYEKDGYYGTRMDILMTLINNIMIVPNKFGIGAFIPKEPRPYYPIQNYYGYTLTYVVPDFKWYKR
ncbi:conserved protein of unknown function [Ruminococcaceae bacterium BL-6]|nr:conserved protein of unknown function [Ruminococcaceae bacterium BL-6]